MSRDTAKGFYDKNPGDPESGYVTPADAQAALDVVYDDMQADVGGADAINAKLGAAPQGSNSTVQERLEQIEAGVNLAAQSVTSDKIANGTIVDADINAGAAIAPGKIAGTAVTRSDTGTVTSAMIENGTIGDADINAAAAIDKSKIAGVAVTRADVDAIPASMLEDGSITNAKVANNAAIDKAKIAGTAIVSTDSGVVTTGMIADGTIVNGDINPSANIDPAKIAGTAVTQGQSGSVTGPMIANGTISDAQINANAAIGKGKIAGVAVTQADSATVSGAMIKQNTVTGSNLVNDTITATQIAANAVGASELADNAVDTAAIADSAVTSAKIAANAVTDDKIASGVTFTVSPTPPASPKIGAEWADTSSPPITVIRKWDGTSWLVWIVTDATVPSIGDAAWGGYMAGIIDTTRAGVIGEGDPSQAGLRYLLIVSPKSIEYTTGKRWKTTDDAGPNATKTLWDGLSATEAMFAAGPEYEAATYCRGLAFPADGGSRWYLPAKHELEVLYRNFKPTTEPHYNASGTNPASDPTGTAYVPGATTAPAQSLLAAFQQGGAQALEGVSSPYYWSSSEYSAPGAWSQYVGGTYAGAQSGSNKTNTGNRVRPVRRFVL